MDSISKPMRFGAGVMLFLATTVMPASWQMAYAQGLPIPGDSPTQSQIDAVKARSFDNGSDDEATSSNLINKRASRLLRSESSAQLRGPRIVNDSTPIRDVRIVTDPNQQASAALQASKVPSRTSQEMVTGAQSGSDIGASVYGQADVGNKSLSTSRVDPGNNQTSTTRMNATEMLPGFNAKDAGNLRNMGADIYSSPSRAKDYSDTNRRNLRKEGCRKTDFMLLARQQISNAPLSADDRVLKVEFFDLVKQPIDGTNPVQYQTLAQPSVYKTGNVKISVETLGGSAQVYWDRMDDQGVAIKYTYTPHTSPKDRNYFTYNHRIAVASGSVLHVLPDNYVTSVGSKADGFKLETGYSVQPGVTAVYVSADLYRTEVNYLAPPANGGSCEPDPSDSCEVPSLDGDSIRWCPGSPGANIVQLYDDQANPSTRNYGKAMNDTLAVTASRKDYRNDPQIKAGVIRGLNAPNSNRAQELVGSCRRDSVSHIEVNQGKPYGVPEINSCSETLINPYPDGCSTIKRSFGLTYIGEQNYATVRAYNKVKVPIIDPQTNKQVKDASGQLLFTYRKDQANVSGSIRTDFTIMGGAICPGGAGCSTEPLPDDPYGSSEGYYVEYTHTPMGGDPMTFAFDGVYLQGGGTSNFTNYGKPAAQWLPSGTASGDGTLHEVRLMAKAYSVPINTFAGCEKYMQYVADGYCRGGKLTCVDGGSTRSIGGVTFGPGLANSGIVDILKMWGTDTSANFPDYSDGVGNDPTPNGPAITLLDDKMCWEAKGETFDSCSAMEDQGGVLKRFFKGTEVWGTDCSIAKDRNNIPLESSPSCKRVPELDSCDTRFKGLYTGICYNPTIAYDCGKTVNSSLPVIVEELGDSCSGAMRCLGTECHRPNLSGSHGGEFAQAASTMESMNMMINEMVCAETGAPPTSPTQSCTPIVFGGKPLYCKIPIGSSIGLTPNCCNDARDGASGAPSWVDYLLAIHSLYKITRNSTFQAFLSNSDAYNQTAHYFGEMAKPVSDAYAYASGWITDNVFTPFQAGFDNLFGTFGLGGSGSGAPAMIGQDSVLKAPAISEMLDGLKQMLMKGAYDALQAIGGDELAGMFFQEVGGQLVMTAVMQNLLFAFQVYSVLKLIGHIIFACKQEEFEWGLNDRWRLCTYVDTCCSKKVFLLGCVEKRQLYCCYKSIASRVISEQINRKGLVPSRPFGYRTGKGLFGNLYPMGGCSINCAGFTPLELASVNWSAVDLTEWTDSLVQSGLFNPSDPRSNYGVSKNTVETTMAVGRVKDTAGTYDQRSSAVKTADGWVQNTQKITTNTETLRQDDVQPCYVDSRKLPFTYPGCATK